MLIVSLCDEKYVDYALPMVASAKVNMPFASVRMHIVNATNFPLLDEKFKAANPKCQCVHEEVQFHSKLQMQCYCTNRRAALFKKIRDEQGSSRSPMVWIDADSLIVKPANSLLKHLSGKDILLCKKPEVVRNRSVGYGRFRGGFVVIGNTDKSDQFVSRYDSLVGDGWRTVPDMKDGKQYSVSAKSDWPEALRPAWAIWMKNQDALDDVFEELKGRLSIGILGGEFCDTGLGNDSILWAAKSKLKQSEAYQKALARYS